MRAAVIAVVALVVVVVVALVTVHSIQQNNHRNQVLAVYDKCLNESSSGPDCQTLRNDCANGDSYACHLANVVYCVSQTGAGCPND